MKALEIEAELPPGSFSQYDIMVMLLELKKLNKGNVYVEIGVQYGRSLYLAAKYSKANVYGVDIAPTLQKDLLAGLPYTYSSRGSDKEAWLWDKNSPPQYIDLLFIDGDHSYHGCAKDIENWAKFVKKGGVILFHDFDSSSPGVVQAVTEFYGNKLQTFTDSIGNTSIAKVQV